MDSWRVVGFAQASQRRLGLCIGKQEDPGSTTTCLGYITQHADRGGFQALSVINDQVQLDTYSLCLLRLTQQTLYILLLRTDGLADACKQRGLGRHFPAGQHHALNAILVAAGYQSLA